ncbi:unnamed protein product [Cutaneotrichosporon oleaginosum]
MDQADQAVPLTPDTAPGEWVSYECALSGVPDHHYNSLLYAPYAYPPPGPAWDKVSEAACTAWPAPTPALSYSEACPSPDLHGHGRRSSIARRPSPAHTPVSHNENDTPPMAFAGEAAARDGRRTGGGRRGRAG